MKDIINRLLGYAMCALFAGAALDRAIAQAKTQEAR
jgi:hypothetical protein